MSEQQPIVLDRSVVARAVEAALDEDGARSDVTSEALVPPGQAGAGTIVAKAEGVVCGLPLAEAVFAALDSSLRFQGRVPEGGSVTADTPIAGVYGPLAPLLSGERVALNFLQRLSGIATLTRRFVEAVAGLDVRIVDTRKTAPGLRSLERYAVRVGGGFNHRYNLRDGVLIKDNHLAAARARGMSIATVIERARRSAPHTLRIEIETNTVDETQEAVEAGADVILLDNMAVQDIGRAVEAVDGRAQLEASGGVTLENVRKIAQTGVQIISIGALTHSAPAVDLSLDLEA
jgi:nicotinate-nucleotide pyrophosphorylase (carboxylating)